MPIVKYACNICSKVYDSESEAIRCEMSGVAEAMPLGLVFIYRGQVGVVYHVAVTGVRVSGHQVIYDYLTSKPNHYPGPGQYKRWAVDPRSDAFWKLLQELYYAKIKPLVLLSKDPDCDDGIWPNQYNTCELSEIFNQTE